MTGTAQGYAISDADLIVDLDVLPENLRSLSE
jgi:hypothetical protein